MFTAWSKIKYFATIGSSLTLAKFVKKQIFTSVRRDLEKIKIETTTKMNGWCRVFWETPTPPPNQPTPSCSIRLLLSVTNVGNS